MMLSSQDNSHLLITTIPKLLLLRSAHRSLSQGSGILTLQLIPLILLFPVEFCVSSFDTSVQPSRLVDRVSISSTLLTANQIPTITNTLPTTPKIPASSGTSNVLQPARSLGLPSPRAKAGWDDQ